MLFRSAEILRLQQAVEARFGTPVTEAALRDAIVLKNRERRALANFYRLGQLNPPALSGSDILKVVYGATFRFDKEALIDELNSMAERVRQAWQDGKRLDARPRILITGCPIGGAAEKVVRAIEENGGWVVGYENCTGAKATLPFQPRHRGAEVQRNAEVVQALHQDRKSTRLNSSHRL